MNSNPKQKTTIIFLSFFILSMFFIVGVWLTDAQTSEAKTPKKDESAAFEVYTDNGMLVNAETRVVKLDLKYMRPVSFQVTGVGGNINCVVFDEQQRAIAIDDSDKDGCDIRFVPTTLGNYTFVLRNSSENVERFAASIVF